jgi:surface polysaccharide O-acyltransferase-like enzyme
MTKLTMDTYLSKKISVISFLSIILVVFIHSNNLTTRFLGSTQTLAGSDVNNFIQLFISNGVARIAVPLFFLISGYLFFFNFNPTLNSFIVKYKKRFFSLFMPFLFWSIWGLLLYYILQLSPMSTPFFTNELIKDYSTKKIISTIFLNPIPVQLWFIQDLIKLTIASPLIYFYVSKTSYFSIVPFVLIWFFNININFLYINPMGILFFILGSFLSIKGIDVSLIIKKPKLVKSFLFLWLASLFITTYLSIKGISSLDCFCKLSIIIGLLAVWFNYDIFCENSWIENKVFYLSPYTFFIYASHEPILTIFKKIMLKIIAVSTYANLFVYVVAPILTIVFSITIGLILKKNTNLFYKIITGRRSNSFNSANS